MTPSLFSNIRPWGMLSVIVVVTAGLLGGAVLFSTNSEAQAEGVRMNPLTNVVFDTERDVTELDWDEMTYLSRQFEGADAGDCITGDIYGEEGAMQVDSDMFRAFFGRAGVDAEVGIDQLQQFVTKHRLNKLCNYGGTMYAAGAEIMGVVTVYELHPEDQYNPMFVYQTAVHHFDGFEMKGIEGLGPVVRVAYGDAGVLWWSYYLLDGTSYASDQIEFCTAHPNEDDTATMLTCAREYVVAE